MSETYKILVPLYSKFIEGGELMSNAIQAVERMFQAIESGDTADAELFIAEGYRNKESVDDGRSDKIGPAEFRETVGWLRSAFSGLRFEISDVIACGDRAVVLAYMTGRHTSDFLGLRATNRSFRQRQVHIFRLDQDGKVCEHLAQRDDLGLRRQLTS